MSNIASPITLLKCFAFEQMDPAALNFSKSLHSVCRLRGSESPLSSLGLCISLLLIWHQRQQCLPVQISKQKFNIEADMLFNLYHLHLTIHTFCSSIHNLQIGRPVYSSNYRINICAKNSQKIKIKKRRHI